MDDNIQFIDNSLKIKDDLYDACEAFIREACGELQAQTQRNSAVDTGQTKGSYEYKVTGSYMSGDLEGYVGSNYDNAIYEEYGTGEYALFGNGRKGGWVYMTPKGEFYHTYGKPATRPMHRAFIDNKDKLIRRYKDILGNKFRG